MTDSADGLSPRRWSVLAAFSFSLGCNNLLFMSYATTPRLSEEVLGLIHPARKHFDAAGELDLLYTMSLITVAVCMGPGTYAVDRWNRKTNLAAAAINAAAAWARYIAAASSSCTTKGIEPLTRPLLSRASSARAVLPRDPSLTCQSSVHVCALGVWADSVAMLSSILAGAGAAILMPTVSVVAARWFESEQAFATGIAIQCGYAGWTLGSLIPLVATTDAHLRTTLLAQAFLVSLCIWPVVALYHDPPKRRLASHDAERAPPSADGGLTLGKVSPSNVPKRDHYKMASLLFRPNRAFWVPCLSAAVLEGISFAIPGVQGLILSSCIPGVHLTPKTVRPCTPPTPTAAMNRDL